MTTFDVTIHRNLGTPDTPSRTAREAAALWVKSDEDSYGFADLVPTPEFMATFTSDEAAARGVLITAVGTNGELAGFILTALPVRDNTDRMHLESRVRPGLEKGEVLRQMWPELKRLATEEGRDKFTWLEPATLEGGEIAPETGTGAVRRTSCTDLLGEHGFELSQIEIIYSIDVDEALTSVAGTRTDEGYHTESWVGATPERFMDGLVVLRTSMSVDIPQGDQQTEVEQWDSERIRRADRRAAEAGRVMLRTVAVDKRTGELAGYTELRHSAAGGEAAEQSDTHVAEEHRGHGLGLAMKHANLVQLAETSPHIRRILTSNASENSWMRAINERLGGRAVAAQGIWEASVEA
ncbi:GNAT family N-acetyltransferase [Corynebacterium doosanense]|uniref:Histone acetyltransferase n=1 Tax=Corynebacterium doosanense CAU 212 = DSM 45436 TaxID=558173 RepID=A0A097IF19_9CORY|nr:hypothetical protein [Corynebacterium doosanense]AIT60718.1 histone acetyltransferase [Corynebacterium doosanense CAU 212 = DSM 45436]